ncbi:hypothetical protein NM208_g1141 [Fusarium decemcellulare]|uniref:Uncharacterized protein n=1 Tax=Fusarium decemcellulare TaxID=57161 RepID=A0ACC1SX67_9HYPO|nr:hypothetical protein NM208_g1141 [Fusarium decemcellulare]
MTPNNHVDAIVIGAGFGGIHGLHVLRELGLSAKVLERAPDIGGTWWYNRYPGCMSDTESYLYRFFWDKEDLQTYPWSNRYVQGSEILEYLRHVVHKHDMRKDIQLDTEVIDASWDDGNARWNVKAKITTTSEEIEFTGRYLITALGSLHKKVFPNIPGLEDFKGVLRHSSDWDPETDLRHKRVGVVGCGATGVQIITAIAPEVKSLISFQRSPQYSVPVRDHPITPEQRAWINVHYDEIIDQVWQSWSGFGFVESKRETLSVSPQEREQIFENLWQFGHGAHFMFGGFGDITTNPEANEEACRFMRQKIRQIIKDPLKAEKVIPREPFARRPLCDSGYYEVLNRDTVEIVNCHENPIIAVTPNGVKTEDGTIHEVDILIFATGFDALDGSYRGFPIRGQSGKLLTDHWADGPRNYLGMACAGFPNMFMINGPLAPFGNNVAALQCVSKPIARVIEAAERSKTRGTNDRPSTCVVVPTSEAEASWTTMCRQMSKGSLFSSVSSWINGGNLAGEPGVCKVFYGGLKYYTEVVQRALDNDYKGFKMER